MASDQGMKQGTCRQTDTLQPHAHHRFSWWDDLRCAPGPHQSVCRVRARVSALSRLSAPPPDQRPRGG